MNINHPIFSCTLFSNIIAVNSPSATPIPCVPAKVVVPSPPLPPSTPMPQNNKSNVDLHLDDIALTLSSSQVVITSTPSNSVFKFYYVVVEVFDGSNVHRVSTFMNESISSRLDNSAIDNLVLVSAFEFVKNVSELEEHYLILYVFAIFCAGNQLFVVYEILMYFILIYRLGMLARLVFCPKFVNLADLIL